MKTAKLRIEAYTKNLGPEFTMSERNGGIPRDFRYPYRPSFVNPETSHDRTRPATCVYPKGRLQVFLGNLRVAAAGPSPPRVPGVKPGGGATCYM